MGRFESKTKIVTDGLVLNLDPGIPSSQPPHIKGNLQVNYLIVAGGGGGGSDDAGGGGAGGLLTGTTTLNQFSYSITVGAGGSPGTQAGTGASNGSQGGNSTAFGLTAIGGGYGATQGNNGGSGGSGGGGGHSNSSSPTSGGNGTSQQGGKGGGGRFYTYPWPGGGGGGASQNGVDGLNGTTGDGGDGVNFSTWLGTTSLGDNGWFAGGGGGGYKPANVIPLGGNGGGGNGGNDESNAGSQRPTPGAQNTGGGGGGSGQARGDSTYQGKSGGSGIVIIRYPGPPSATGGIIEYRDGITYHIFNSSGTFTLTPTQDLSGNKNNGMFINGAYHTNHLYGGVFEFDGSNDYIIVPDSNTLDGFSEVTFEAWVNSTGNSYDRIFSKNASSVYNFSLSSDNTFYFYINGQFSNAQTPTIPNQWNHLIGVYTGNEAIFYLNGSQVFSEPFSQGVVGSNSVDLYVGIADNLGSQFRGSMGPVRIYNKVLTEDEIIQNFNADRDRFGV